MNRYKRSDRVSGLIHRAVAELIENELWDARFQGVTVTGVEVTRDLKIAAVYVSMLKDGELIGETIDALNGAAKFIRSRLGDELSLRYTPDIQFRYDKSIVEGMRMDALLSEITKPGE